MLRAFSSRVLHLVIVIWLVSVATFFLLQLVPGDPATAVLGTSGTPEQYAQVRESLGLDKPIVERYGDWIGGVMRGDFGRSLTPPFQPVSDALIQRLPVTIEVAVLSLLLALALSVPIGIWSAHRMGERFDRISSTGVFALMSLPTFLAGLLLIQLLVFHAEVARVSAAVIGGVALLVWATRLALEHRRNQSSLLAGALAISVLTVILIAAVFFWPTFPRQGFSRLTAEGGVTENLRSVALPVITVALGELALFTRVLRAEMVTTLDADYVLAARAKGMPTRRVLTTEALRPASFSLITVAGVSLGRLMGGTLIVEVIFNLPGMGRLIVDSIQVNDFVTVQAGVLVLAFAYVIVNAAVDVLYTFLDPRVRHAA